MGLFTLYFLYVVYGLWYTKTKMLTKKVFSFFFKLHVELIESSAWNTKTLIFLMLQLVCS